MYFVATVMMGPAYCIPEQRWRCVHQAGMLRRAMRERRQDTIFTPIDHYQPHIVIEGSGRLQYPAQSWAIVTVTTVDYGLARGAGRTAGGDGMILGVSGNTIVSRWAAAVGRGLRYEIDARLLPAKRCAESTKWLIRLDLSVR